MLCKNYGWSIEYVLDLTRPQINILIDGMVEVADIRSEASEEVKSRKVDKFDYDKKRNKVDNKSVSNIFDLASYPGFDISKKAETMLGKIMKKNMQTNSN